MKKRLSLLTAVLLGFALIAGACGSDSVEEEVTATTAAPTTTAAPEADAHLGDGSLGEVRVDAGEAIQIRSLNAISGDVAFLGVPNENGIRMAVEDYGQIHGFDVDLGVGMDDLCSADGGQAAASIIVANEDVVGVIGTSCSGAAAAASPLISEAGLVMISGSNTSPSLTSDLAGTAGSNYKAGYYRTAHNDLYQGAAAADFALTVLGVTTAAAIHDGDPYTEGLATAFTDAFEAGGGTITGFTAVNKGDTDMVPVLTEIAAGAPEMLFFPIFQPEGDFIVQQAGDVSGMGGVILMAADGLLNTNYLAVAETEGMYFSGPDVRYGANANQSTRETAADVLADYNTEFGEAPAAPFWAHSYDAAVLLMDAIAAASYMDGDTLVIDRAGVREHLNGVSGYDGLIGNLSCDAYGDCSSSKITVIQNIDTADYEASTGNVVFEYAPTGSQAGNDIVDIFEAFDANGDGEITIGVAAAGPADDGAYYQAVVDAAKELSAAYGFNEPIVVDEIQSADAATELSNLAEQGVDIIIVGASEIAEPLTDLTVEYADIFWYCNCGAGFASLPGLAQSVDDSSEISYSAGYASGLLLQAQGNTTASFIGCCDLGFEKEAFLGFQMGLQAVDSSFSVTYVPTGAYPYDFDNVQAATEAFNTAAASGVGVVYPYLGGAHEAVVQLANDAGVAVLSAGSSDVCTRDGDISWDVAVRFDAGDYVAAIFPQILAGTVTEGETKMFKVGVDPEPGAVICNANDEQQAAMDAVYAEIASGALAGDFGAIKGEAYSG